MRNENRQFKSGFFNKKDLRGWNTTSEDRTLAFLLEDRINLAFNTFDKRGQTQITDIMRRPLMKIDYLVVDGVCIVVMPDRRLVNITPVAAARALSRPQMYEDVHKL